jgi:peptidase E
MASEGVGAIFSGSNLSPFNLNYHKSQGSTKMGGDTAPIV